MSEQKRPSRAGTWGDWPVLVILVAVGIILMVVLGGGTPTIVAWGLLLFGVVSLMIRRGAFKSRD